MPPILFLFTGVIVPASVLLPIAMAVIKYRYLSRPLKAIFLYLIIAGLTNVVAAFLAFRHIRNLPLLHVYTLLELLLLGLFFYQLIDNRNVRKGILAAMVIFPPLCIINFCFIQSIYTFNSYTRPLESILLIFFSVCYFYLLEDGRLPFKEALIERPEPQQTRLNSASRWSDRPGTWMVTGILLYFSSALIQFAFSNIVSTQAVFSTKLLIWNIHASLVLIMYVLFFIGFSKYRK